MMWSLFSPASLSLLKTAQIFPQGLEQFTFRPSQWPWGWPIQEISIQKGNSVSTAIAPLRVALYCRSYAKGEFCTSLQRMHLLELIEARNKVDPTPWKVIRIYEDERFNEGTLSRPGLFLLREAVSRREIDIVVTLGLNRLARSPSHLFIVGRELFENDVQAISLYRDGSGAVEAKNLFPHIKQAVAMMRSPRDKAAAILTAIGE